MSKIKDLENLLQRVVDTRHKIDTSGAHLTPTTYAIELANEVDELIRLLLKDRYRMVQTCELKELIAGLDQYSFASESNGQFLSDARDILKMLGEIVLATTE